MQQFSTIKKFEDEFSFQNFTEILKKNNIPFETESFRDRINPVTMVRLNPEFQVKVPIDKFDSVNEILERLADEDIDKIDRSYFMFDFSNEELIDVLEKPDEWASLNVQLSKKILKERGIVIDEERLNLMKKSRIKELQKPEENPKINLWMGYISSFLGGILGIFIGWDLMNSMKILPNGEKFFSYDENNRSHGFKMVVIGLVMLVFWVLLSVEFYDLPIGFGLIVWLAPVLAWLMIRFTGISK
jgi:hypothetical protein